MLADLQREFDAIASDESVACSYHWRLKAKLFARVTPSKKCGPIHQWSLRAAFCSMVRDDLAIQQLPVPAIARVQGIATAAGVSWSQSCDLR